MQRPFYYFLIPGLLFSINTVAQTYLSYNQGHSHNDYHQKVPLLTAYRAGMGSIEADIFLKDGKLYVAHDTTEISPAATLQKLYLTPLANFYVKNKNRPYKDPKAKLQLVIDIKKGHQHVIPVLIRELSVHKNIFNYKKNLNAIHIVISGDVPAPVDFKNYPDYLSFDGRPYIDYTPEQLERVAMISNDLKSYTKWKGKDTLTTVDEAQLKAIVKQAHDKNKPFRFWATQDNPLTWTILEKLGVDWINTDHPEQLREFFLNRGKL